MLGMIGFSKLLFYFILGFFFLCVLKRMGMKEKTDFIGFEVFLFFIERRNLRERRENKCQGAHIEWLFLLFSGECMGGYTQLPFYILLSWKNKYSQTQMKYKTYKTQKGNLKIKNKT